MVESEAWRRYRTAVGTDEWRECELDYFLIACGLRHEDVARIVSYTREGAELAKMMDHDANRASRRPLEEASEAWHSPTQETLIEAARRLGWTRGPADTMRVAPLPRSARIQQAHGITADEYARRSRAKQVPATRRRELDALVKGITADLADDLERRYVVDQLRRPGAGRPGPSQSDLERWRADAERLEWDTTRLAAEWKVPSRTARWRIAKVRG